MFPDATQVADLFHVVRLANQALDDCRRRVQNEALGSMSADVPNTAFASSAVPGRVQGPGCRPDSQSERRSVYVAAEGARRVTTRMWMLNTNTQAGKRSSSQGMTATVRSSRAAVR